MASTVCCPIAHFTTKSKALMITSLLDVLCCAFVSILLPFLVLSNPYSTRSGCWLMKGHYFVSYDGLWDTKNQWMSMIGRFCHSVQLVVLVAPHMPCNNMSKTITMWLEDVLTSEFSYWGAGQRSLRLSESTACCLCPMNFTSVLPSTQRGLIREHWVMTQPRSYWPIGGYIWFDFTVYSTAWGMIKGLSIRLWPY